MTREETIDKILDELSDDFIKADLPLMKGMTLFAKVQNAVNYIETLSAEPCEDAGEISDGYHTFNQLYHQRAILFAAIVNQNPHLSWKSYKHSDGQYCFDSNGEWFIVGIDTPQGSYTYHYAKEYWEYFHCQELECGKEWDGHTEDDVTRLLTLKAEPRDMCEYATSGGCQYDDIAETIPTEGKPCDAVSRRRVFSAIHNTHLPKEYEEPLWNKILALPSVQPIRPKGKWERYGDTLKCPICRAIGENIKDSYCFNFCPNCGADMRGEE